MIRLLVITITTIFSNLAFAGGTDTKPVLLQMGNEFLTARLAYFDDSSTSGNEHKTFIKIFAAKMVAQSDNEILVQLNDQDHIFEISNSELQKSDHLIDLLETPL